MMGRPPPSVVPGAGLTPVVTVMEFSQYRRSILERRSVLGQNLIELFARLLDHGDAALDLGILPGAGELLRCAHQLAHGEAERTDLIVALAGSLPGERASTGCPRRPRPRH